MRSFPISNHYMVEFNKELGILWSVWKTEYPPYFSLSLLREMEYGISTINNGSFMASDLFRYFVLRSCQKKMSIRPRKSATLWSRADFHLRLESWVDIVMSLDKRRLALLSLAMDKQNAGVQ